MPHIITSAEELVGNTPLLNLSRLTQRAQCEANVLAKLEMCNPTGSAKDRAALGMLNDAEASGALSPGATIIEPTSGNTGIGLAAFGTARGYNVIIVMPDSMSAERQSLMRAYGARLVLTPGAEGMQGAIKKAQELSTEIPGSFIPDQFTNPANARAHYCTTGPEIWEATEGALAAFIAGIGTGGTISGTGRFLKEKNPNIRIIGIEPDTSAVLSGGKAGAHGLQGIGAGFVPDALDTSVYDEIIPVSLSDALTCVKELAAYESILAGISSGAALHAALCVAQREEFSGQNVVILLPDTGERYLSSIDF